MIVAVYTYVNKLANNETEQLQAIKKWLIDNQIKPSSIQYYQDYEDGIENNRTAFEQLRKDICAGAVSTVVVHNFNRITSTHKQGIFIIENWLRNNCRVVSVTQNVDVPSNAQVANLLIAVAQMNVDVRKERQAIGLKIASRKGKMRGGRPKGSFTKSWKKAVMHKKRGRTLKEIAKLMEISEHTVQRYLAHAKYLQAEKEKRKRLTSG